MFRQIIALFLSFLVVMLSSSNVNAFVGATQQSWEKLYVSGEEALERKHYKEAEAALQSALFATGGNTNKEMITLDALGELYEGQENYPLEEQIILSSLHLMRSLRDYPGSVIGATYLKLSAVNFFMNRAQTAEQYARAAIPILRESCGPLSPDVAVALNNLGWIEYQLNKLGLARTHFRQSLYMVGRTFGERSVFYGLTANNLAGLYARMGNRQNAFVWYEKSSAALNASLGASDALAREVARRCHELQPAAPPSGRAHTQRHSRKPGSSRGVAGMRAAHCPKHQSAMGPQHA